MAERLNRTAAKHERTSKDYSPVAQAVHSGGEISKKHRSEPRFNNKAMKWVPTHGLVQEDHSNAEVRQTFHTGSNHYLALPVPPFCHQTGTLAEALQAIRALEQHAEALEEAASQGMEQLSPQFIAKYSPWSIQELVEIPKGTLSLVPAQVPPKYTPGNGNTCLICDDEQDEWRKTPCGHVFCRACISTWLDTHNTCPMCRLRLAVTGLYRQC